LSLSTQAVTAAFVREPLRLHRGAAATSAAASTLIGVLLVTVMWGTVDNAFLLGWVTVLAAALGTRLAAAALTVGQQTRQTPTAAGCGTTASRLLCIVWSGVWLVQCCCPRRRQRSST